MLERERTAEIASADRAADRVGRTVEALENVVAPGPPKCSGLPMPVSASTASDGGNDRAGVASVTGRVGMGDHAKRIDRFRSRSEGGRLSAGDSILRVIGSAMSW